MFQLSRNINQVLFQVTILLFSTVNRLKNFNSKVLETFVFLLRWRLISACWWIIPTSSTQCLKQSSMALINVRSFGWRNVSKCLKRTILDIEQNRIRNKLIFKDEPLQRWIISRSMFIKRQIEIRINLYNYNTKITFHTRIDTFLHFL